MGFIKDRVCKIVVVVAMTTLKFQFGELLGVSITCGAMAIKNVLHDLSPSSLFLFFNSIEQAFTIQAIAQYKGQCHEAQRIRKIGNVVCR